MFEIIEGKKQITINLTRNDSCEIATCPFVDSDANKIYNPEGSDSPIMLGDMDYIMFSVASPSGKIYLKKLLTKDDYNEDGVLTMKLSPEDTIDMQPFRYLFSFSYMPNNGEDCYTYATGIFNLLPAIATVKDLPTEQKPDASDATESDEVSESGGDYDN